MPAQHVSLSLLDELLSDSVLILVLDVAPPGPWEAFAHTDGRIVTGANPASAHVTAQEAVKAFDKL